MPHTINCSLKYPVFRIFTLAPISRNTLKGRQVKMLEKATDKIKEEEALFEDVQTVMWHNRTDKHM